MGPQQEAAPFDVSVWPTATDLRCNEMSTFGGEPDASSMALFVVTDL